MSESGGLQQKATRDRLYRVPFSYVCSICNKKTKPNDGHAHPSLHEPVRTLKERERIAREQKERRQRHVWSKIKSC